MNKIFILTIAMIFMGGCSLKDISKPIVRYDIEGNIKFHLKTRSDKILKVSRFKTPINLFSKEIWYQRKSLKVNSYLYSGWNQDFSTMVEQEMSDALYKSRLFKSVFSDYSKVRADFVLEGEIVDALQHVEKNRAYVTFEVRLYLIDYKTSKLIGSNDFSYTQMCKSIDAAGAVEAYDEMMKTFNKEVILWLEKLVKEN